MSVIYGVNQAFGLTLGGFSRQDKDPRTSDPRIPSNDLCW